MADKDKPEPEDIDKDAELPENAENGDLGFADDSWVEPAPIDGSSVSGLDREFIPRDSVQPLPEDAENKVNIGDTFVPDVPIGETAPTGSVDDEIDIEKTWVPSSTPTAHGFGGPPVDIESPTDVPGPSGGDNDDDNENDVNKTWVPSSTPTVDSAEIADEDDPFAVDKTWVPSETPTVNAADEMMSDAERSGTDDNDAEEDDTARTWVPSSSPTHHAFGDSSTGSDDDSDPNRTWVPSDTPTADGLNSDQGELGEKTVVAGPPPGVTFDAGDSAVTETVEAPLLGIDQTVFSQTMGMRSPDGDDVDKWQQGNDDLNEGDTAVIDIPEEDESLSARKTQIWSQQSGDGLSSALTIRNAPVAGDSLFDNTLNSDKPDYQILKKLAEGGMGAIYVARQTSLGRELAIKTLKPLRERDRKTYTAQGRISQVEHQRREMFLSEALVTGNLVHPHIIPIHDLCQTDDGSPFYSMKRVHGTPWNEKIGEMTLDENLEVLMKVCDAMAYAHHNGVVNRDLKPENVMLGEFGEVLVLDWGLAVPASQKDKGRFPSPAAPFGAGTPAYMSPELWTGPENRIGVWSDIYLLGATLFETIVGQPPHEFPEPDSAAGNTGLWMTIDRVVRRNSIRDTEHTGELMDIARKAMSTSPKERHRTVLQFQAAIKEWQEHEESRRLTRRADDALQATDDQDRHQDYQHFQTAAALFEEAQTAWPANAEAREGLRNTRLRYASVAHRKGDYDLGLQIVGQDSDEEFQTLRKKLGQAKWRRKSLKTAIVIATMLVIGVGIVSFIQRRQIVALVGTKESLEEKVDHAEEKLREADILVAAAQGKIDTADGLAEEAERKLKSKESELADKELELANKDSELTSKDTELQTKTARLTAANAQVDEVNGMLQDVNRKYAEVGALLQQANKNVETTQLELLDLGRQKEELNREKLRAGVDLQNAKIASSIRNADFPAALRIVEELLVAFENNEDLQSLPDNERDDRIRELKARRLQLQRRATLNEVPVQSQVFSTSGKLLAQGDARGNLSLKQVEPAARQLPEETLAALELDGPLSNVRISDDESLIVASSGQKLVFWDRSQPEAKSVENGSAAVSSLSMKRGILVSADEAGLIQGWDVRSCEPLWSIRSTSSIRDVEVLPESGIFLYAGSRGGQSADILAYRLPPKEAPRERPIRLGQLRLPRSRNFPPRCIAVSPDETVLLVGNSRNGELMLLRRRQPENGDRDQFPFDHAADLARDQSVGWVLNRHQRPVNDISFSEDGGRVVTASDDRSVCVWSVDDQSTEFIRRLEGHGARVNSAVFLDASGRYVLSASADRSCRSWDVDSYETEQRELERNFKLDTFDSALRTPLPRLRIGKENEKRPGFSRIATEQKSPFLLTGIVSDESNTDRSEQREYIVLNKDNESQRGSINSISMSHDGTRLVTGADDGSAVIWDTVTGRPIKGLSTRSDEPDAPTMTFEEGHDFNMARLRFLPPNGDVLLTTGFDGTLCLWDADTRKRHAGRQELRLPGLGLVNAIAASPDGALIATSASGTAARKAGAAIVWQTESLLSGKIPEIAAELEGFHRAEVSAISFSPDQQFVATGGRDGRVGIWRVDDSQLVAVGQIHARNTIVSHLEWAANDRLLSAGFDGRISLVAIPAGISGSAESRKPARLVDEQPFQHDRIPVERLALSPDRSRFVTISVRTDSATQQTTSELELWDVGRADSPGRIHLAKVEGRIPERIVAVNWSPEGDRLAVVADDHLQILETRSWKVATVLNCPGLGISDAVFAPAGTDRRDRRQVIATYDGTAAHLWNTRSKKHIVDFRPLFAVQSTAYLQQQNSTLLVTGDRALRVFQADETHTNFGHTLTKIGDPHAGIITDIQFADSESARQQFVSTGADGTVALWTWDSDTAAATFVRWLRQETTPVVSATWIVSDRLLITEKDGRLRLVSTKNSTEPQLFHVAQGRDVELTKSRVSHDGKYVAVAGQDAASGESLAWVFFLDEQKLKLHCTIQGGHEAGGINDICFLPDSPYLVTGGADGGALIWNWLPLRASDEALVAYEAYQFLTDENSLAHNAPITRVAVSDDGTIATASEDGTAIVWNNPFRG